MLTKWNKPEDITGLCVGDRILMVCEERNTFGKMEKHVVILEATEDGWTSPDETYIGYTPGDGTDWISEKDFRKLLAIREAGDEEVPYGYCPVCGTPGISRERRLNGNDRCRNGHVYPSTNAKPTTEDKLRQQLREAQAENNRYHDEAEVADALVLSLQEEVKTLTAERDEARREMDRLKAGKESGC